MAKKQNDKTKLEKVVVTNGNEPVGNETKKAIVLLVIFGLLLMAIPYIMWSNHQKTQKILNEFNSYFENTDTNHTQSETISVLYLGKDGCSYCTEFQPTLDALAQEYGIQYDYINVGKFSVGELSKVLKKANISLNDFGTPTVLLVKDGKALAHHIGVMDRENLFSFFQENGVIGEDIKLTEENPNLTKINYTRYAELLKSSEKSVVVIGQTSCGHCIQAKPVLNEIAGEENIDIYYLNYTDMTTEERQALQSSLPYFEENPRWGTPLNLIIQNNGLVDSTSGFYDKETFVNFLKQNNMID